MTTRLKILLLLLIIACAAFLRFYNLMFDYPYFFDPDERNMASAITQFKLPAPPSELIGCIINEISGTNTNGEICSLNPHFFAYGQFPLYLAFISDQVTKAVGFNTHLNPNKLVLLQTEFPAAIFWLRFYSALFSLGIVLTVYFIAIKLVQFRYALIISAFTAFMPGLIQAAHFGTTESLLTFFFMTSILFSLSLGFQYDSLRNRFHPDKKLIIALSVCIGLALGSKLTGLFFTMPVFFALIIKLVTIIKLRKRLWFLNAEKLLLTGITILVGALFIYGVSSPYNFVDPADFKSAVFGYEADVATGRYEAFYTRQFINTVPVLFQLGKIFPFTLGWPVMILGILGFIYILLRLSLSILPTVRKSKIPITNNYLLIIILSFLVYFIPNAVLYAKWTRFMTPVFPVFSLFAGYLLNAIRQYTSKRSNFLITLFTVIVVLLNILPGVAFMSVYAHEDTRVQASRWIYLNIPEGSYILSETANVVDIPVGLENVEGKNYSVISFDFYHLDENPLLFMELLENLEKSNYIFVPSRRIFANYQRDPAKYPLVTKYYQLLFSGKLGYEEIARFNSFPTLGIGRFSMPFPDEQAEETFTVFDHPVIRIYQKTGSKTSEDYRQLFSGLL